MPESENPAAEPVTAPAQEAPAPFTEADFNKYLSEKGLVAKTPAEIQREVNEVVGKTHKDWEGKVSTLTGIVKPDGKKGLDWLDEVIKPTPAPAANATPTPAPMKVADEVAAAQIKSLQEQLNQFKKTAEDAENSARQRKLTLNLESSIQNVLDGKDTDFESKARSVSATIAASYEQKLDERDNTVFYKDGEAQINPATSKPYTAAEIIKRDFAYLIPKERPVVKGTERQPNEKPLMDSEGKPFITARNEEEISAKANELGLIMGTPERTDFIVRSKKASGIN